MRKILGILMAAVLILSAAACNSDNKTTVKGDGGSSPSSVTDESSEPEGWINSVIPDINSSSVLQNSEEKVNSEDSSSNISSDTTSSATSPSSESGSSQTVSSTWSENSSSLESTPSNNSSVSDTPSNNSSASSTPSSTSSQNPSSTGSSGGNSGDSQTSVWSGNIAESFSGGTGSSSSPYIIRSGEELALLAYNVNRGNSYAGKVFMLGADIDLGGREWTPIGNGKYAFEGVFIGCDKTIKNISITKLSAYTRASDSVKFAYAGLFGYAKNAEFDSLILDGIKIKITAEWSYDYVRVGGLVGELETNDEAIIRNLHIKNMKSELTLKTSHFSHGAAAGFVAIKEAAILTAERIEAESVLKNNYNKGTSYSGGIFGYLQNKGTTSVSDFACYSTVYWYDEAKGDNYGGALGALSNIKGTVKLSNAFSELKFNTKTNVSGSSTGIKTGNAIIGIYYTNSENKQNNILKNLFGYVASLYNHYEPRMSLYGQMSNTTVTNCDGSMSLPTDHGFKSSVWNLIDLSHPTIRY